jgi:hypothetical protein
VRLKEDGDEEGWEKSAEEGTRREIVYPMNLSLCVTGAVYLICPC